ncbi:NAD-dependent epimerase/dehydratase family protein [Rhizosaccharibacter radicis]|uniref:NAD-dependent epimerase/dehydratase family protein n=1 Tax=Rhizosaccharibacter radicis TaxID=2782605 RepID=A0ABT1VV10_9PROT|nr:NAD-dependent epimerase/dehydratase family protein [Acetobacteraceae bacterium KSS12]
MSPEDVAGASPAGRRLVALTGGSGFLGRHVAAVMAARGWRVRLLVRRWAPHPLLRDHQVELVPGDLDDEAALRRLTAGADAVVHAAALVKARHPRAFDHVNRGGTGRLASATRDTAPAIRRFVLVSSQAARAPHLSPYAASKRAAEEAAAGILGAGPLVVLRPPVIYGPGDTEGRALLRLASRSVVPVTRAPDLVLSLLHVRDVAAAIAACCEPDAPNGSFELSDGGGGVSWPRLIIEASRAQGRPPPRLVPVPDGLLHLAAWSNATFAALLGHGTIFGPGKIREILHRDWRPALHANLPAERWRPAIALADGLRETVAWWRGTGGPPDHDGAARE